MHKSKTLLFLVSLFFVAFSSYCIPSVTITSPVIIPKFKGGTEITFVAKAFDQTDGYLKKAAFNWQVNYRHEEHWHDNWSFLNGDSSFTYTFSKIGDPSSDVFFRFRVTVTNSLNETNYTDLDIHPVFATFTITSNPVGARFSLGTGMVVTTPSIISAPIDYDFSLSNYLQVQSISGVKHSFKQWSFCSTASSVLFNVPAKDTLITMYFKPGEEKDPSFINNCNSVAGISDTVKVVNTITSINTFYQDKLSVFPNPTFDQLNIVSKSDHPITGYKMFNALGLPVIEQLDCFGDKIQVQTGHIPQGIYYLEIFLEKEVKKVKIIKLNDEY